jgi:hypothetical protein
MKSVYSAVRTGPLNKAVCAPSFKGYYYYYYYHHHYYYYHYYYYYYNKCIIIIRII